MMKRIEVSDMVGGRRAIYVADIDMLEDELSSSWGQGEEFDDPWDLGRRITFAFRLDSGQDVSLTRVQNQLTPGFSLFIRADSPVETFLEETLRVFLSAFELPDDQVLAKGF
ncbi:hypothetical protein ACFWBF_27575 [Streptomyces sp. NPDC060028]|uniref:hypothetical protein n=1 Tax=Streptomyces sp. NPDC060028 TaxID=3347041 RepID=UPI0036870D12